VTNYFVGMCGMCAGVLWNSGIGHCWKIRRWDLRWTCVALGLDTGSLCDCVIGEQVIVVRDCATIG